MARSIKKIIFALLPVFLAAEAPHPGIDNSRFILYGDYLYWKAQEDGLDYTTDQVHFFRPNFQYIGGFRIGLGYYGDIRKWQTLLTWTQLKTSAQNTTSNTGSLTSLWDGSTSLSDSENWKLRYRVVDWTLSREISFDKSFILSPIIGIRYAQINQTIDTDPMTGNSNYRAGGALFGCKGTWQFVPSFSLFGQADASFWQGRQSVEQTFSNTTTSEGYNTGRISLGAALGLLATFNFPTSKTALLISAAYEWNHWFAQNAFRTNVSSFSRPLYGDLNLQGLTLRIRTEF